MGPFLHHVSMIKKATENSVAFFMKGIEKNQKE